MGYESRLHVVSVCDDYAQIIGMVDLCKIGGKPDVFKHPICYDVYIDSGNEPTIKDKYGDHLTDCSLDEAIDCIEKMNKEVIENNEFGGHSYRRFTVALGLLRAIANDTLWENENIRVIHYGY